MDLRFFAAPHGLSQLYTSFIASPCLGIHRVPFVTSHTYACASLWASPLTCIAHRYPVVYRAEACSRTYQRHSGALLLLRFLFYVYLNMSKTNRTTPRESNPGHQRATLPVVTTRKYFFFDLHALSDRAASNRCGARRSRTDDLLLARQAL
jgi:hypothetical protein